MRANFERLRNSETLQKAFRFCSSFGAFCALAKSRGSTFGADAFEKPGDELFPNGVFRPEVNG